MSQEEDRKKQIAAMKDGEVLQRAFKGTVTLEFYKSRGHVVVCRGNKEAVFYDFDQLKKVIEDFALTVEARR